ncbi:Acetylornithine deacetylase [Pirellula sp. SH-Sr6A]|uniref:M20/M25/M40 family metallo-hydrolase n=1 Tax=Pirellula sp. SH-Sr6A TaxID=1632865 RepID=UPI00078EBF20|nr:M20/M25/M40 family metallo-hydrolase [Pirellula sp. SH-Sr6A]AMV32646.1 Acetylornithine deacetylase [Pirellula sp. SH-Sr6A]
MNVAWESAIDLVTKLVRFPSVSHESNEEVSQAVADELFRIGFEVEWLSYRDSEGKTKVSLVAKRGKGTGGVAYLAHTDVVPADDWSLDFCGPFDPVVQDGRLYGRGACDMKGSLACALVAASIVPTDDAAPLYFVVTSDEEVGMHGARLVDRRSQLFEEMVESHTIGIVGEPTKLEVVHAHKGGLRFHVLARGKSAHTSTRDGLNANYALIPALEPMLQLRHATERDPRFQNPMFDPPTLSWNMTITNEPEAVNVTTSLAQLNNFLRLMPGVDVESIVAQVEGICERHQLDFVRSDDVEPWSVAPDAAWIQQMLSLVGRRASQSVCYATDAGVLQRLQAMMICGPGDIQQAHRSDEWISLEQLQLGVETYAKAFCALQSKPSI